VERNEPRGGIAWPLHPGVITMCDEITLDGKTLETILQLRAALPTAKIIKSREYEALPSDESCLCGVDVRATLVQAGCQYVHESSIGRWKAWTESVSGP
jgi:hypothetical protein